MQYCNRLNHAGCTKVQAGENDRQATVFESKTEHVFTRSELFKKDVTHSAWRESEFNAWLQQRLVSDRDELLQRLQEAVKQHLADHQQATLQAAEGMLSSAFAAAGTPGVVDGSLNNDAPLAAAWRRPSGVGSDGAVEVEAVVPLVELPVAVSQVADSIDETKASSSMGEEKKKGNPPKTSTSQAKDRSSAKEDGPVLKSESSLGAIHKRRKRREEGFAHVGSLKDLVNSPAFELVCISLIFLNTFVMAIEVQYNGCIVAGALGHSDCPNGAHNKWPGADVAFKILALIFNALFLVEFAFRVAALRLRALTDAWIWFDVALIAVSVIDMMDRFGSTMDIGVNPSMLRIARVARMVRMLKILKPTGGFPSLLLLVRSIHASKNCLGWALFLLLSVMTCFGMLINQLIQGYLADNSLSVVERAEVFDLYGSYTRTIITMFELTLGNWAPPSRMLMSRIGEWWGMIIVLYRGLFCFAIVNVTAATFITETNRAAAADDEVAMIRKERMQQQNAQKLKDIFHELDESGDGTVTWEEFHTALHDPIMVQYLSTMDMEVGDLEGLFTLLDDGDGKVECEEFVHGITTLRGQAKNIDLLTLLKLARKMNERLLGLETRLFGNNMPVRRNSASLQARRPSS